MTKIKDIVQLRDTVLQAIEDLKSGKIELAEASTIAKLSETVISGLKSEIQYSILIGKQPKIAFYGKDSGIALDTDKIKKLL